jgi:hypothetical protein
LGDKNGWVLTVATADLFTETIVGEGFTELCCSNNSPFFCCRFCEKICGATKIMQKNKILAFLYTFQGSMVVNLRLYNTNSLFCFTALSIV